MVRSPLFGVRPHQLLGIKGQGPYSWYGPWVSSLHGLLPLGVSGLGLLLKHLQIIRHRIRELLVVLAVGMVDIPIRFPVVIPDVRIDPIAEVRVAGLLFPEDVGKIQKQHIHLAFVPIQNGNAKGMVLICDDPRDELDLCPIKLIETHIAGPAYIGGVRILWGNDFVKLLFEKVHIPSLDADNDPEIHGRSEGRHEAGKQDGGSRPLELAGFSVLEVGYFLSTKRC